MSGKGWSCMFCNKALDCEGGICGRCGDEVKVEALDIELCAGLIKALNLELEGQEFYSMCAKSTDDVNGKIMFEYLSGQEKTHYGRVLDIFKGLQSDGYCRYAEVAGERGQARVFEGDIPGGLAEGGDSLDAINIAINAEDNSIRLYESLADKTEDDDARVFFRKLAGEEADHKNILEAEVEYITKTGEFHDFRTVTS
jgi:rubrerythrin